MAAVAKPLSFNLFVNPLNKVLFDCDAHFCFHGFHNSAICLVCFILPNVLSKAGARMLFLNSCTGWLMLLALLRLDRSILQLGNWCPRTTSRSIKGFYSLFKQIGFSRLMRDG